MRSGHTNTRVSVKQDAAYPETIQPSAADKFQLKRLEPGTHPVREDMFLCKPTYFIQPQQPLTRRPCCSKSRDRKVIKKSRAYPVQNSK
jgi:hypothetical protein